MSEPNIDLFIKPGCPWCVAAQAWLDREGYQYRELDVIADENSFQKMIDLTGQSLAPCLQFKSGTGERDLILADFGVEELEHFVEENSLEP